jgi:uncharacterized protein (TIGR03435 family)
MKRPEKNIEEFVLRHLGLFEAPQEEMDLAEARIRERLRSTAVGVTGEPWAESDAASRNWRLKHVALVIGAVAAAVVLAVFLQAPREIDAHAVVAVGSLSRVSTEKIQVLRTGDRIEAGEILRTNDANSSITLADGSRVEMRSHTEFSVENAQDGVRIHLFKGGLIINAARQVAGHLYVQTKDVTVSVIGTVFLVNAEEEGSRVAVIQGEVHVQQGTISKKLLPGQQVATNPLMASPPMKEEIAWSHSAPAHLALLQQSIAAGPAPLQFEVVSIKPPYYPRTARFACRGVDGTIEPDRGVLPGSSDTVTGAQSSEGPLNVANGRCVGQPDMLQLVSVAYGVARYDISVTGPDWVVRRAGGIQRFSIEAKAEDVSNVTKEQLRLMLQSMLADRFKLKIRREPKERDGFALLIAKSGLKLKSGSGELELPHLVPDAARSIGDRIIKGNSPLKELADFLLVFVGQGQSPSPIVDKTGLTGMYEYTLALHSVASGGAVRGTGGDIGGGFNPPVSKALEEQLGLTLLPQKVQSQAIVIEDAEKPSEN